MFQTAIYRDMSFIPSRLTRNDNYHIAGSVSNDSWRGRGSHWPAHVACARGATFRTPGCEPDGPLMNTPIQSLLREGKRKTCICIYDKNARIYTSIYIYIHVCVCLCVHLYRSICMHVNVATLLCVSITAHVLQNP